MLPKYGLTMLCDQNCSVQVKDQWLILFCFFLFISTNYIFCRPCNEARYILQVCFFLLVHPFFFLFSTKGLSLDDLNFLLWPNWPLVICYIVIWISTYINTKMSVCLPVCLSVCSGFSRPFRNRLAYPLAQSFF